jgi:hypothetical protein
MSEPTQPDAGAPAPEPIAPVPEPSPPPPPASDAPITAREAGDLIAEQASDTQSSDKDDAGPAERPVPGETKEPDPASEPSIEPPRSWSKEHKEAFKALPRHLQQAVAESERAREADFLQRTRETAEQRKAAEALAQQAEQAQAQARAAYERSLPQEVLLLEAKYHEEFGTPTEAEIAEWENTDPAKAVRWNGALQRVLRARRELEQQQSQQAQQQQKEWQEFAQAREAWKDAETQKFLEKAPEWKDQATYGKKVAGMMDYLENGIGFEREFLERAANEYLPIQIHDHKFQLLAWKGYLYDEAQKAARSPSRAPVPPVQRPGVPPARGEANEARLRDLNRQLDRTGDARSAARLIAAMNGR